MNASQNVKEKARKKSTLRQALAAEKTRADEYLTRLKYLQADFENYKKRLEQQVAEERKYYNEKVILQLLEIIEELELAVRSSHSTHSVEILIQGVEMTLNKLRNILKGEGVLPIESLGKPLDPRKHEVLANIEKEDVEELTIVEEIRKGYIMKERVIRPSIVKVAVKPQSKLKKKMVE